MIKLGVNIDHVATIRQARKELEPDPVVSALVCQTCGADSIVAHLREDRRHINDHDIRRLKQKIKIRFNCEMSIAPQIVEYIADIRPDQATLVPEHRQEITTEGGLDVVKYQRQIKKIIEEYHRKKIDVSLFIAPAAKQIQTSAQLGAKIIELHTGEYAHARSRFAQTAQLKRLSEAAKLAKRLGLVVSAGHGLNYQNVKAVARIAEMEEFNIGHSIISRSVFVGLPAAVQEMKQLIARTK